MDVKPGAGVADDLEDLGEALEGATEPIGAPHSDHVELAAHSSLQQRIELRALVTSFGTADALVFIDPDDGVASTFGPAFELLALALGVLGIGAHTHVDRDALRLCHRFAP